MNNKTQILGLLLILLVIPTSTVFARGKSSEKEKTAKTSCEKQDNNSEKNRVAITEKRRRWLRRSLRQTEMMEW
tara:strand:- start:182 stop:403 length:222 start_codon:yes stop_codon:yes gene_type:complete